MEDNTEIITGDISYVEGCMTLQLDRVTTIYPITKYKNEKLSNNIIFKYLII